MYFIIYEEKTSSKSKGISKRTDPLKRLLHRKNKTNYLTMIMSVSMKSYKKKEKRISNWTGIRLMSKNQLLKLKRLLYQECNQHQIYNRIFVQFCIFATNCYKLRRRRCVHLGWVLTTSHMSILICWIFLRRYYRR